MRTFPDETIPGDGLVLRALAEADLPAIVDACRDPVTQRWLPLPDPYTLESARWYVDEFAASQFESGRGLERAIDVDGALAGVIGLKDTDWQVGSAEIGYWVCPWARGRGLARRAVAALTPWAFRHGMHRIVIRVAPGNAASLSVPRALHFVEEGIQRHAGWTHDGHVDLIAFSKLSTD